MSQPKTREEEYLSAIASGSSTDMTPVTREEIFLAKATGQNVVVPEPRTRKEVYLRDVALSGAGGSSVILKPATFTENGNYPASDFGADGFSSVEVDIDCEPAELWDERFTITGEPSDEGVTIPEGYVKPEGTLSINANGDYDVTYKKSVKVNVPDVEVIPDGYIKPEGSLPINSNGDYNVTDKAAVNVNVPIPNGYIKPEGTLSLTSNGNYDVTTKASVQVNVPIPTVTSEEATVTPAKQTQEIIPANADYLSKVTVNPIPNEYLIPEGDLQITENGTFDVKEKESVTVNVSSGGGTTSLGSSVKYSGYRLNNSGGTVYEVPYDAFKGDTNLYKIDLAASGSPTLYENCFNGCTKLRAVIIRSTNLAQLVNINSFTGTPIEAGLGYIYVPSKRVSGYQSLDNWSTFANQFRALEDYTVDGKTSGELDDTKI